MTESGADQAAEVTPSPLGAHSSYPTVKEETLQEIVDVFKKKSWTLYQENKPPTKGQIKDLLDEKIAFLIDDPEVDWVSGGRLCVVRHAWSETYDFMICIELEEIEDIPQVQSSPTTARKEE